MRAERFVFLYIVEAERKRLSTKKSLTGMFSGTTAGLSSIPKEELLSSDKDDSDEPPAGPKSILTDEPDAWG
jgi:hypothetical protein